MQDRVSRATITSIEAKYINSKTIKRIGKDRIRKEIDSVNPKWGEARKEGEKALGGGAGSVDRIYKKTKAGQNINNHNKLKRTRCAILKTALNWVFFNPALSCLEWHI